MSATIINLIIQLIAGAVGGNAAGAALKDLDLGKLGNTIAGALGGAGGGRFSPHYCQCSKERLATSMSAPFLARPSAAVSPAPSSQPWSA